MTESQLRTRPPAPSSVSAQAQQYLNQESPYGKDITRPTDTRDIPAWRQYVAQGDAAMLSVFSGLKPSHLQVEHTSFTLDGVDVHVLRPEAVIETPQTPIYLDIHGGGLILGGGPLSFLTALPLAARRDAITWALDYRMPPDFPYPAALDDCLAHYRKALEERPAHRLVVRGSSAGGNLAAALLLRAKDEGLPMPAALILNTPELDLTESGDSFHTHLHLDHVLQPLMAVNRLYAGDHDLAHPYLSPLFGDVSGFPPTILTTGTRDLFLSNTVRMHRVLLAAGVPAELHVFEAMPHGGFGGISPEDAELARTTERFAAHHLDTAPIENNV